MGLIHIHRRLVPTLRGSVAGIASCLLLAVVATSVQAAQTGSAAKATASPEWVYPVIPRVGGVHPRPNLPVRPDPKVDYHIFVDMVSDGRDPAGQYNARCVYPDWSI